MFNFFLNIDWFHYIVVNMKMKEMELGTNKNYNRFIFTIIGLNKIN